MSRFFTEVIAKAAVESILPELHRYIEENKREGCHIVILDPQFQWGDFDPQFHLDIKKVILYERAVHPESWSNNQKIEMARAKALLSLREQRNSGGVPAHLLRLGDIKWQGGVYLDGIAGAISGLKSHDDEAFTLRALSHGIGIADEDYQEWKKLHPNDSFV